MGQGIKTQRRAAIFGRCVSGMTGRGHFISACQLARPKKLLLFFVHATGAYDRKRREVAVVVRVLLVLSLCKSSCHVLNVIHLKCFIIELPCFICDTFEMQKCRVTESYGP